HGGDEKKDAKSGKSKDGKDKKGNDKKDSEDGDDAKSGADQGADGENAKKKDESGEGDGVAGNDAGEEKAPATRAKLEGTAMKLFRASSGGGSPAPSTGAGPGAPPKPDLKTPADVKKFCAPDPIAMQKLSDVDGERNIDPDDGGNEAAKDD